MFRMVHCTNCGVEANAGEELFGVLHRRRLIRYIADIRYGLFRETCVLC